MSTPTPAPERPSASTAGENVAYIASTNSSLTESSSRPTAAPSSADPLDVDGTVTVKSGGVPLTAWQSNAAELAKLLVDKQLGPFMIEASLGTGGMAAVFRAYDVQLDRKVALKILPPVLAAHPEHVQRFEREAKVTAKLDHEHIARVHQFGQDQGLHYIAYEFVEGTNLRDLMGQQGGRLPIADGVRYILQAAQGLAHTSARGVIHRDIKPSNLVITAEGKVKLVDLGLARNSLAEEGPDLTHSGATLGTFDYLAPEQAIDPRSADVRSDIYSLGCTLYHCVTGRAPVPQGTAARKLHSHQLELPTDPREFNPETPSALVDVLSRMLAKRPEDRYQSANELVDGLKRLTIPSEVTPASPSSSRPEPADIGASWLLWTLGFLLLIGGTVGYEWLSGAHGILAQDQTKAMPAPSPEAPGEPANASTGSPAPSSAPVTVIVQSSDELIKAFHGSAGGILLLRGEVFELPVTDSGAALTVRGGDWQLRPADGTANPILRIRAPGTDGGTFCELRGGSLQLQRLRLETSGQNQGLFVLRAGATQLVVQDCELVPKPADPGVTGSGSRPVVRLVPGAGESPSVQFRGCVVHGGDTALELAAAGGVQWEDCWIGPYREFVSFPELGPGDLLKRVVFLKHCCVVQARKACFHVAGMSPTRLEVEQCLFSRTGTGTPIASDESVWLLKDENANLDLHARDNLFHRIPAFLTVRAADGSTEVVARDWNQMKTSFPAVRDAGTTAVYRSPWLESRPWQRFKETNQLQALLPKEDYRDNCPDTLLGQSFRSVSAAARINASPPSKGGRTLTVDGRGEEPATFTTLNSALGSITDEEETTILIQQQGNVAVKPSELGNSRVILKAAEGFCPTLVFHRDTVSGPDGDAALFRLHDGEITLEGVKARLESLRDPARSLALVSISGTGRCKLKDSVVTLKTGGEVAAMVCTIADPTGMMAPPPGKAPRNGSAQLELVDSFIRGTGEVLHVQTSRPFIALAQNCAVVLDGAAFVVEGNRSDMSMPPDLAQLRLDRTTVHATRGVLHLHGTPGMPQLVALRCQVTQCLLSVDAMALLRVDANQTDAELRRRLIWLGRRNCYAVNGSLLQWQSLERNAMATQYDASLWTDLWGGDDEQAQIVKSITFVGTNKSIGFAEWEPGDLMPKLDALTSISLRDVGVAAELLPHGHSATP